jgi:hypothetical protein
MAKKEFFIMKNIFRFLGIAVITTSIGFFTMACEESGDPPTDPRPAPETLPDSERWITWKDPKNTETDIDLEYDEETNKVTVTVSGTAQPNNEDDGWFRSYTMAKYSYTATGGKIYVYKFKAWTSEGTRGIKFGYYWTGNPYYVNDAYWPGWQFEITTTQQEFTLISDVIPSTKIEDIAIYCADTLGTFYIEDLSIEAYNPIEGAWTGTVNIEGTNRQVYTTFASLPVNHYWTDNDVGRDHIASHKLAFVYIDGLNSFDIYNWNYNDDGTVNLAVEEETQKITISTNGASLTIGDSIFTKDTTPANSALRGLWKTEDNEFLFITSYGWYNLSFDLGYTAPIYYFDGSGKYTVSGSSVTITDDSGETTYTTGTLSNGNKTLTVINPEHAESGTLVYTKYY